MNEQAMCSQRGKHCAENRIDDHYSSKQDSHLGMTSRPLVAFELI